jgi:hypothetical protein
MAVVAETEAADDLRLVDLLLVVFVAVAAGAWSALSSGARKRGATFRPSLTAASDGSGPTTGAASLPAAGAADSAAESVDLLERRRLDRLGFAAAGGVSTPCAVVTGSDAGEL